MYISAEGTQWHEAERPSARLPCSAAPGAQPPTQNRGPPTTTGLRSAPLFARGASLPATGMGARGQLLHGQQVLRRRPLKTWGSRGRRTPP
jgi:hypothetical protein